MTYSIPFMPCPIDKHQGETWEKLVDRDLSEPVTISSIDYMWSSRLELRLIREDTFQDFTLEDWQELMFHFYKLYDVFGFLLTLEHYEGSLTTFRAYKPETVRYYEERRKEGTELMIKARR